MQILGTKSIHFLRKSLIRYIESERKNLLTLSKHPSFLRPLSVNGLEQKPFKTFLVPLTSPRETILQNLRVSYFILYFDKVDSATYGNTYQGYANALLRHEEYLEK